MTPPASRSRRPSVRKGDLKEQAILATAERLLAERHPGEISVDELARGAGISRPTFYFYFESKDAVLASLVERIVGGMLADANRLIEDTRETPWEGLALSLERFVAAWRTHGPVLCAAVECAATVPAVRRMLDELMGGFIDAAATQIRRDRRAGRMPAGPPSARTLAASLVWMTERCLYATAVRSPGALPEREFVSTLATIWFRATYGAAAPPASPAHGRLARAGGNDVPA